MRHSTGRQTKAQAARIERMLKLGCICCRLGSTAYSAQLECHHIVRGNKRLGHRYTLPLCGQHHRNTLNLKWRQATSIAHGRKAFEAVHGGELELWKEVQRLLQLPDDLPMTKVIPRKKFKATKGNGHLKIEHNVPVPDAYSGGDRKSYPFGKMKPGDSFLLTKDYNLRRVRSAAYVFGKNHGVKFAVRTTAEGPRVWRVS